jgi:hypothetical protein
MIKIVMFGCLPFLSPSPFQPEFLGVCVGGEGVGIGDFQRCIARVEDGYSVVFSKLTILDVVYKINISENR